MNELIAFVIGFGLGALLAPTITLVIMLVVDWRDGRRLRRGR